MGNQQATDHKKEDKLENQEHEKAALNSSAGGRNEEDQVVKSSGEIEDPHVESQPPDTEEHDTHHTSDDGKVVGTKAEEKPHGEKETPAKGEKEHVAHETVGFHAGQHSEEKQEMKDGEELKVIETELENKEIKHNLIPADNNQSPDESHASHSHTVVHGHKRGASVQLAETAEGKLLPDFHDVSVEEKTIILEGGDSEKLRDSSLGLPNEDEKTQLLNPQTKDIETKDFNESPDLDGQKDGSGGKEKRKPKQPPFFGSFCCGGVQPLSDF